MSLDAASAIKFELDAGNPVAGNGINDLFVVNGALTLDGTLQVTELGGSLSVGAPYTLFTYTGALTNNGLDLDATFLAAHPDAFIDVVSQPGQVLLAVPEPGALPSLFAGLGALGGLRRRRRA